MQSYAELQQENQRIQGDIKQIRKALLAQEVEYKSRLNSKDAFIDQLKEALILARNTRFAANSEALRTLQLVLFNEAELDSDSVTNEAPAIDDADTVTIPAHQRKRGGRKPLPAELPRIEVVHDLSDEDKVCPHDGYTLTFMSDKISEQLDIIPMQIQVIRHIRKQYQCPCCQSNGETMIKTAAKPKQAIEKSQASSGLLAYIATAKYADSLPLYRQSTILGRFGIDIDRTTLANWMIKCGQLVQPLINRIEEDLLGQDYIQMDETPVQVLNEEGKTAQSKSYMWVRSAGPPGQRLILFDYDPSRSSEVPKRLLADYDGAMMVDGYVGYDAVCAEQAITRLGCWAHARCKFVEAVKAGGKRKTSLRQSMH